MHFNTLLDTQNRQKEARDRSKMQQGIRATYLIHVCVGKAVKLGSEVSSGPGAIGVNVGTSRNLDKIS